MAGGNTTGVIKARVLTSQANQVHEFGKPLTFEFQISFKESRYGNACSPVEDACKPFESWQFSLIDARKLSTVVAADLQEPKRSAIGLDDVLLEIIVEDDMDSIP